MRNLKALITALAVGDALLLTRDEIVEAAAICRSNRTWKWGTKRLMFKNGHCHELSADNCMIVSVLYDGEIDRLLREGTPVRFNNGILRDVLFIVEEIPRDSLTSEHRINDSLQQYAITPNSVVLRAIIEDVKDSIENE